LRLHRRDKEVFVQVSLIKIENDQEASLIAILSDATELKKLEAQFVQSAEGQGTEFNLILPIFDGKRAEIAPVIEKPKIQPRTYGDGVILLVEDEAPVRTFASRALQLRGYQVIEAASAEEALDQLNDPNLKIDVFVTDIGMPGRDGPSWVKEALEQRPNTRVVFVSGYAEYVLETQQAAIPNSVFLPKPFSLDDLTETVQQQFH
jgi:two-component system cell cycle sensor histidine kinase/response regulator CckA